MSLAEAKDRIRRLEELVGEASASESRSLITTVEEHDEDINRLQREMESSKQLLDEKVEGWQASLEERLAVAAEKMQTLEEELALFRRVLGRLPSNDENPPSKIRVPDPKPFGGNRDAKELENFVWDVEQYFKASKVPGAEQVSLASMFLAGDAKLWWRTRVADDQAAGRQSIATWSEMKKELQAQFLPHNTAWIAREALKKLKHTGSVREYVKAFSSLMLDIHNMSEEDKLFNFMSGLQNWAQVELRRQGVQDIPAAMAAAEGLADFRANPSPPQGDQRSAALGKKPAQWADKKKKKVRPAAQKKAATFTATQKTVQLKPGGCFNCGGPHRVRECPNRAKVNAMASLEEPDGADDGVSRMNPIQLLNALATKVPPPCKALMYVRVQVNGQDVRAMVDTGATNTFLADDEAHRLGVTASTCTNRIKAVNSKAVAVHGAAEVRVRAGSWEGTCSLMIIPLDDFKLILGLDFFTAAKAMIMPHLRGMLIGDAGSTTFITTEDANAKGQESPSARRATGSADTGKALMQTPADPRAPTRPMIQTPSAGEAPGMRATCAPGSATHNTARASGSTVSSARAPAAPLEVTRPQQAMAGVISAKQLSRGVQKGLMTYVAALIQIKPDQFQEVPDEVAAILEEFADVMPAELPKCLPPRREIEHAIDLELGARPPAKAPYRMAPAELGELRRQLDELLEAGLIRPSKAPYGAPVLFQRKADGALRMCIDYRALNKVTVKNKYPVPNAADLFDRLAKATLFTKLDLRSGYWQVRVVAGDEPKTTCVTRYGAFEFLVMPFGLTNAPATFCNLMTNVLYEYLDRFVVVYLDDIVVYSGSLAEHASHLKMVFAQLKKHGLYVKKEKCLFAQSEIAFLGHWVGQGCIRMDRQKVRAIQDWPAPTTVAGLRSFLGLANYYRRFIAGYSNKVSPLTDLLKKDQPWDWSGPCQQAFEAIKEAVSSEPILRLPDFEVPFEVHTDASDRALGGVLVQQGHPIAFESRKFQDAERRYSAHEKEMTAVVHCLEAWRHYLLGTRFTVVTDNVANTFFKTQKKLSPKQARWQELLAEYDFEWLHKPGRQNTVADALSRQDVQAYVAALSALQSDIQQRVAQAARRDRSYEQTLREVAEGRVRRFWVEGGLLWMKGRRLYIPQDAQLRRELLKEAHDTRWAGHPGIERMHALLSKDFYWPKMFDDVEAYVRSCLTCQTDKVERRRPAGLLQPLPVPERPWASVSMDFVGPFPEVRGMQSVFVVVDRFSKYAIFVGAPKECTAEVTAELFFANVVKYFGVPGDIVSDRDARFTSRFWSNLLHLLGTRLKLSTAYHPQTDGQTERVNAMLEEYLRHYVTATQRNWLELLDAAQFSYNLHRSSATDASPAELCLGFQPVTPARLPLLRGQGPCPAAFRFAEAKAELLARAYDSLVHTAWRMKSSADKRRRHLEFQEGDLVLLKLPHQMWKRAVDRRLHPGLLPKYEGPFKILKKVGAVAYRLDLPDYYKVHSTFHVSFLKPYHGEQAEEEATARGEERGEGAQFHKEIEQILGHRTVGSNRKTRETEYLIQWKGEDLSEASWEKAKDLWRYESAIQAYLEASMARTTMASGGGGLSRPQDAA